MNKALLSQIAQKLVAKNGGILAADEGLPNMEHHFKKLGIEDTEETRRAYREMLFTTPEMEKYINGVILFSETFGQKTTEGVLFPDYLVSRGILPGIKVDLGTLPFGDSEVEKMTDGLGDLAKRLADFRARGAQFTKWRAIFTIGDGLPTAELIKRNAVDLAEYTWQCQDHDLVPIVEPEVLMDGDHTLADCERVTSNVLQEVFLALNERGVELSGMLLKPNMILPGSESGEKVATVEIAQTTYNCLLTNVPKEVPGIVFLSGGQSETEASANLNAINLVAVGAPWKLSFSFGRALQNSAMKIWDGKKTNVGLAQTEFRQHAYLNSLACAGKLESV